MWKHKLKEALYFLRLTDDDGILSITHIGCMVVLTKVALNPNPSVFDMGSLLVTLSLYYGKQHLAQRQQKLTDENKQAIADISAKVNQNLSDLTTKVNQVADKASGLAMHVGLRTPPTR
jgi:hypothetical protein